MNALATRKSIVSSVLLVLLIASQGQAVIYVNASAQEGGDGSSWARAYNNLDSALNAASIANSQTEIWIAKGVYVPSVAYVQTGYPGDATRPNLRTFLLPSNVSLIGGFKGNETSVTERSGATNSTVLSGDLGRNQRAYHVLSAIGATNVILDTLTVTGGYANGRDAGAPLSPPQFLLQTMDYSYAAGGGLFARGQAIVTLNNMVFTSNASDSGQTTILGPEAIGLAPEASGGGAIAAVDDSTTVNINNSTFTNNTALNVGSKGGALSALLGANINVVSSSFTNNVCDRIGGAIHGQDAGEISVIQSSFANNRTVSTAINDASGGGIGVINTNLSVLSSTFVNNMSGVFAGGGAIFAHFPFNDSKTYHVGVDHSAFTNNTAAAFGGGAIAIVAIDAQVGSGASITNSSFDSNTGGLGGAIYLDGLGTFVTSCSFNNNKAWTNGGAIFVANLSESILNPPGLLNRANVTINNSIFQSNAVVGIPPKAPITPKDFLNGFAMFVSNGSASLTSLAAGGGAISAEFGANLLLFNETFIRNKAGAGNGGALLVGGSLGAPIGVNEAYTLLVTSKCQGNTDVGGANNSVLLNPANLVVSPDTIELVTDGSCP